MSRLCIGKVVRALGLKGYVGIAGSEGAIARIRRVTLRKPQGEVQERTIEEVRRQGKLWGVRFDGIADRSTAEEWIGAEVLVDRQDIGEAGDGFHWWGDLEGLSVQTEDGEELGRVSSLYVTGGVDILVVKGPAGERLIPLAPYVKLEREAGRLVVIDPPEGLLKLSEEKKKGGGRQKERAWPSSKSKS